MFDKFCYSLSELAGKWRCQEDDILHMAANEKLRLSVNLDDNYKIPINGWRELIPLEISGFFPHKVDAYFAFFRDPTRKIVQSFPSDADHERRDLFRISRSSIVVMAAEVSRMEAEQPELVMTGDIQPQDTVIAKILNPKHPWHSEFLALAVKAWLDLYADRKGNKTDNAFRPSGGNGAMIAAWLKNNAPAMGPTTLGHFQVIINPSKQGGPNKLS